MKKFYEEKILVTSNDVDRYFEVKLSTIFKYLQQVSTNHAELIGLGKKDTSDKGMFWVIARMNVIIHKMPHMLDALKVTTHPGDLMMFIFPRYYQIYSESGELLISAVAYWTLLDSNTHKVIMKPFGDGYTFKGEKLDIDLPSPRKITYDELFVCEERKVRYSDTDLNGHLNNTKYIDYIIDTHNTSFYDNKRVKEISINFEHEIKDGDIVTLYSNNLEKEVIVGEVNGVHNFVAEIIYEERKL